MKIKALPYHRFAQDVEQILDLLDMAENEGYTAITGGLVHSYLGYDPRTSQLSVVFAAMVDSGYIDGMQVLAGGQWINVYYKIENQNRWLNNIMGVNIDECGYDVED